MNGLRPNLTKRLPMPELNVGRRICFLFLPNTLDLHLFPSLVLDPQGQIIDPFLERDHASFMLLNPNEIILIFPSELATIHQLALPHLSEKKALLAIQFSLEPKLTQRLSELHLAWVYDAQKKHYLVANIDKQRFRHLLTQLQQLGIHSDKIVLDFSALQTEEALDLPHTLLLNGAEFQGAIPHTLISLYEHATKQALCFYSTNPPACPFAKIEGPVNGPLWIAQRLLEHPSALNLCQGEFTRQRHTTPQTKLYYIAGALGILWIVSLLICQSIILFSLNHRLKNVDAEIATQYRAFFPSAKQIISPRFRIEQLLKHQHPSTSLWILFDKLEQASQGIVYHLQNCEFNHQKLSLTLELKQYEDLEKLETRLRQQHLQVKQTQSSQQDHHVNASLELTL